MIRVWSYKRILAAASFRGRLFCERQFQRNNIGTVGSGKSQRVAGVSCEDPSHIRNIGIIAHIDAGKTTTTERMLYYSGTTRHLGDVDKGDTVMDFMAEERERGITINSAAISFMWNRHNVNLIDTPGHVDFTLEVERSLRVLDGAITILDASAGVEAQTVTVWKQAKRYMIPQIAFLNKMDKSKANFDRSLDSIRTELQAVPVAIQLPIGSEGDFEGVIDIVSMQKLIWGKGHTSGNQYKSVQLTDSDGDLWLQAYDARETLIEHLADIDDAIAGHVLNDTDVLAIPTSDIIRALRGATLKRALVPILCGSSLKNKGVQPLLDAIVNYLPGPTEVHHDLVSLYNGELCALAFKFVSDKQRGLLTFARLYEGHIKSNSTIYNLTRELSEKISRIYRVSADEYKEVGTASAGQIVALGGLQETITGDMLVSSLTVANKIEKIYEQEHSQDVDSSTAPLLQGLVIPDPVFFCSIEPASLSQQRPLEQALDVLTREDPSLQVRYDKETGQTILAGMGELHLEVIHHRIQNEFGVDADLGPLQIAYRESISQVEELKHSLEQTIGERHHRVSLSLSVRPAAGAGIQKEMRIIPSASDEFLQKYLRRHHIAAINSGLSAGLGRGPILGFQVTDVEVQLHELAIGRGTSMPMLTAAVSQALFEALKVATPCLLEPIVNLEIDLEESHQGQVMNDLAHKRSQIIDVQMEDNRRTIVTRTPLSELLGYSTKLRTMTSGTAVFTMEISSYEPMSQQEQRNAIQRITGFLPG